MLSTKGKPLSTETTQDYPKLTPHLGSCYCNPSSLV